MSASAHTSQQEKVEGETSASSPRRAITAAAIGNFAEWYDFAVYGVVASIMALHFFPSSDPVVGLISAYVVFGLTYVSRPIGGLIAGWLGDTLGRRRALSFTILLMCAGTALIGFIPSYNAIGVLAPILLTLCRLVQGLGTGGEYSSAISFVYEHSQARARPIRISYLVTTTFLGITSAVLIASLCTTVLGDEAFEDWGWRVLFWLAAPLGLAGMYLRRKVSETPQFKQLAADRETSEVKAAPIRSTFRTQATAMILFFCIVSSYALITPILSSYFITFIQLSGGLTSGQSYNVSLAINVVMIATTLAAGRVMFRYGLQRTFIVGGLFIAVVSVPAFAISTLGIVGALIGGSLLSIGKGLVAVAAAMAMSYMFPAKVRVTAGAFAYNVCTILFGAAGPSLGIWLNSVTGSNITFSVYLAIVGALSAIAAIIGRQRLKEPADELVTA
ncbi:MFS transporter [Rhodococcus sp. NPDC019627]|uniref:Putative MFS transporter n=1 Tax=Rhodococcus opacus (strain B4) TaxID=632772 RepID=C1BDV5_RHOOB|nr:MFS transporter [Rhodococcus opacus]BAH47158.1 putative MFS transporter [Rhodococcus opacus B4]